MRSRLILPLALLLAAGCTEPARGQTPEHRRFQARYEGVSPREWSGMAGFCQAESERVLILVSPNGGMMYFILPEHRAWRAGDYSVDDLMSADPEFTDPTIVYATLMNIDPREAAEDGVLYDTNATSGTLHVDSATATHLTGTVRMGVRVRVNDPAGPSRTEAATIHASFNAYRMRACPSAMTG